MKTWQELALAAALAAAVLGVALVYSRRYGEATLAAQEIADLESIPVLPE